MENPITYKYDDWLNGKVIINGAIIFNEKNEKVVMVDYDNFEVEDQQEIRKRQKEYFEIEVNNLLLNHTKQFESRYSNSELKDTLINEEIQQCYDIIFGEIPNSNYVHLKFWTPIFIDTDLHEIQQYIDNVIKKGIVDNYEYIQSPNSPFLIKNKPDNRIYASFIWRYYLFLNKFNESRNEFPKLPHIIIEKKNETIPSVNLNDTLITQVNLLDNIRKTNITDSNNIQEEELPLNIVVNQSELNVIKNSISETSDSDNPNKLSDADELKEKLEAKVYTTVFIDKNAFSFFKELKKIIVKKKSELADYSFIFHKMLKQNLLVKNIKQKDFIDYLNKHQDAEISYRKLNFKNQPHNLKLFEIVFNKFYPEN
jgi:hypothetical protein